MSLSNLLNLAHLLRVELEVSKEKIKMYNHVPASPSSGTFARRFAGLLTGLVFSSLANAGIIYSATGDQLAINPDVIFPGGSHSINGTSLDLDPNAPHQLLMRWDLLPASSRGDLIVDIEVDYTALSGDNDPRFILSDGINAFTLVRSDNDSGRAGASWGTIDNNTYTSAGGQIVATGLGSVDPFAFSMFISDDGVGSSYLYSYQEGGYAQIGNIPFLGNFLNTDNPLSFYIGGGNNPSEHYRINSLKIEITSVPTPMTLGIFALGLAGLLGRKLQRTLSQQLS